MLLTDKKFLLEHSATNSFTLPIVVNRYIYAA